MANEFEEFQRSYVGGWGKIPLAKTGGIRTFKVLNIPQYNKVKIEIITAKKATKELTYDYPYVAAQAKWYYPESKYVNTPNFVVRSVAYPNRQYSKILTNENAYFAQAIPTKLPPEITSALKQSVLDVLDNYDTPYPTYREALEIISRGDAFARAFTKRFLIMLDPKAEFPILVYKNNAIGYDRGDLIVCIKSAEKIYDMIISATRKGVMFNEDR